jgi:hypothetical protein
VFRNLFYPILFLTLVATVPAQETINYATISGRITDQSGAIVQNAVVTARQLDTNWKSQTVADREGRFRFPYLNVGPYEIKVQQAGFSEAVRSVTLTVGAAFDLPISLSVAATETNVLVTSDATVLETGRSQIAGSVSKIEVTSLPLNGRNFIDLALLVPGVSPTNTASTQLFAETSAVPGQGISIGSQRNFSNSFIVDGLSANDDAAGLSGAFYGLDVVQEFQVVTAGGQAEFGRALGGYVSMITRSGTNSLHGDLYGYLRNQRLNAANPLSHTNLPLTQVQSGASLGGPIAEDRTFYFVNFEQRILNQSGLITISPSNVAAINTRLAQAGYAGPAIFTGLYSNPVHNSNFLARADHRFSARDQFSIRYSLYNVDSANSRGVGGLSAVSAAAALNNLDQTIAAGNVATLSPRTVNETRGQFTRSNLDAAPNDAVGPAVSISGIATLGRLSGSPTARVNNLYEAADNLSHQAGAHALRAGVDFLYNDLTITFPQSIRGSYSFSSLSNFLNGVYNNSGYTQSFGNPVIPQGNANYGFYAQDEWQVKPRLTLDLGVRYDLQFLKTVRTDTNNISPRLGFAWAPFKSRQTVVRGSFGLFYDRIPLRALANALLSSGNTTDVTSSTFVTVNLSPTQAGAPVFPNILTGLPAGVLVNFSTMDPHMQNAYSEQGAFEIEQQIGKHGSLTVGYQHVRGLHLIVSVNQNTPTCAASGTNNGCRPNPNYGNNRQYSSLADSHYDGLHVSFVQRPVRWGSFRVSYTFSKALDNVGEFFFSSPIDNFNLWRDYGRSDDDQRHRVAFDGIAHLPRGFQLSGSLQYYSALPFNITTGANTIQGTAARPILADGSFISRNSGRGFDLFVVNARLGRTFRIGDRLKLEAIAEAFNVLNHRNDMIPNGTFGAGVYPSNPLPTFGTPAAVGDPRTMQLAARLSF